MEAMTELDFNNLNLYGREDDVKILMDAYDRSSSSRQIVWMKGYSGVGKTTLVEYALKRDGIHFCWGKFKQFHSTYPFSALTKMLSYMCFVLECECDVPSVELSQVDSEILVKIIPELKEVLKGTPCSDSIDDTECSINVERGLEPLKQAIQSFVKEVCTILRAPLVLFLDDLQWVDMASLEIMKNLLTDADIVGFLFVGAYRDNEINQDHALTQCIHEIVENQESENDLITINLQPLDSASINRLVADLTHMPMETVQSLSCIIHQKTDGNCFYSLHMIRHLYAKKLLFFSDVYNHWEWDARRIRQEISLSSNVVDFMAKKLSELSTSTLDVLTLAAFMGTTLDIELLQKVHSVIYPTKPIDTVKDMILIAAEEQLIEMKDDSNRFSFSHDRVAAGAYEMIPEGPTRQALHLQIGRCLQSLFQTDESPKASRKLWQLNLTVDQLNRGSDLLEDPLQRLELAKLNLQVAELVMAASAFKLAMMFLNTAVKLLGDRRWESQYELTLCISDFLAKSLFANGEIDSTLELVKEICSNAKCPEERYEAQYLHVYCFVATSQVNECIRVGIGILHEMSHKKLTERPKTLCMFMAILRVKSVLTGKSDHHISNLPLCTNQKSIAIMKQLSLIMKAAMFAEKENKMLFALACCHVLELSFRYGVTETTSLALVVFGFILTGFGNFDEGYRLASLSLKVMEHFGPDPSTLVMVHGCLAPLKKPLANSVDATLSGYRIACSHGDMPVAGFTAMWHLVARFNSGLPLESIVKDAFAFATQMIKYRQHLMLRGILVVHRNALEIIGRPEEISKLASDIVDDDAFESFIRNGGGDDDNAFLTSFWVGIMETRYLLGNMASALEFGEKCWRSKALRDCFPFSPFYFTISALVSLHFWKTTRKRLHWKRFRKFYQELEIWVKRGNPNCRQYIALLDAELLVLHAAVATKIRNAYDKSIMLASRSGYAHDAALASELAGRYFMRQQDTYWARHYLFEAVFLYRDWNATAMVRKIEKLMEKVLSQSLDSTQDLSDSHFSSNKRQSFSLTGRSREDVVASQEQAHDDCRRFLEPGGSSRRLIAS